MRPSARFGIAQGVDGFLARFGDHGKEAVVGLEDHGLDVLAFFLGRFARAGEDVLEFPAFVNLHADADFAEQFAVVDGLDDDADGAGDGGRVGEDFAGSAGGVVAAGRGDAVHVGDDGFLAVGLLDGVVQQVGGGDFAAGGVDAEDDGGDVLVGLRALAICCWKSSTMVGVLPRTEFMMMPSRSIWAILVLRAFGDDALVDLGEKSRVLWLMLSEPTALPMTASRPKMKKAPRARMPRTRAHGQRRREDFRSGLAVAEGMEGGPERPGQGGGDERFGGFVSMVEGEFGGAAVQPCGGTGGFPGFGLAGQQGGCQTGEDIAGPAGGEAVMAGGIIRERAAGASNNRARAFQKNGGAGDGGWPWRRRPRRAAAWRGPARGGRIHRGAG